MYAEVNEFLPALENEDLSLDLLKVTSSEQALDEGYSGSTYQVPRIVQYCLHDTSDDPSFLSIVSKHGIVSEYWTTLMSQYIP